MIILSWSIDNVEVIKSNWEAIWDSALVYWSGAIKLVGNARDLTGDFKLSNCLIGEDNLESKIKIIY